MPTLWYRSPWCVGTKHPTTRFLPWPHRCPLIVNEHWPSSSLLPRHSSNLPRPLIEVTIPEQQPAPGPLLPRWLAAILWDNSNPGHFSAEPLNAVLSLSAFMSNKEICIHFLFTGGLDAVDICRRESWWKWCQILSLLVFKSQLVFKISSSMWGCAWK